MIDIYIYKERERESLHLQISMLFYFLVSLFSLLIKANIYKKC